MIYPRTNLNLQFNKAFLKEIETIKSTIGVLPKTNYLIHSGPGEKKEDMAKILLETLIEKNPITFVGLDNLTFYDPNKNTYDCIEFFEMHLCELAVWSNYDGVIGVDLSKSFTSTDHQHWELFLQYANQHEHYATFVFFINRDALNKYQHYLDDLYSIGNLCTIINEPISIEIYTHYVMEILSFYNIDLTRLNVLLIENMIKSLSSQNDFNGFESIRRFSEHLARYIKVQKAQTNQDSTFMFIEQYHITQFNPKYYAQRESIKIGFKV